jgi:hypothetical protein
MKKELSFEDKIAKTLKVAHQLRMKKGYYYRKWAKAWREGVKKALKKSKS